MDLEFKGTKGKWFMMKGGFSKKNDDPNLIQIYATNENLEMVCKVYKDQILHNDIQDFESNAKLIASAPEMFEILSRIIDAIYSEEIIIKENIDNEGFENFGARFYNDSIKLLTKITK